MAAPKTSSPADPQEHQVYLPNGWQWVKISDVYQIDPKNVADDNVDAAFIPMEKVSAGFGGSYSFDVRAWGRSKKGHTHFADGDVAFAKISPCFENRKSMVLSGLPNGIGAGTTELIVLRSPDILPQFTYFMVSDSRFINGGRQTYKGTAGQQRISMDYVKNYEFPLPPLPEQRRIVARIEALFSDLDNGVATLRTTKRLLGLYRQSVLKEAFEGSDSSNIVEISEITDDIRIGPFGTMLHKSDYVEGGIPVINPMHIKGGGVVPNIKNCISSMKAEELSAYRLRRNDVIMGRRGEMGRTAPITDEEEGWICGTGSLLFRLKPEYDATFYSMILSSPNTVHYLEDNASGTTMSNLNEDIVKHIPVPKITKKDQSRITNVLESRLSVCSQIEQTVDAALQKSDALRQSILKRAFEGEL